MDETLTGNSAKPLTDSSWLVVNGLGRLSSESADVRLVSHAVAALGARSAYELLVTHRVYTLALSRVMALPPTPPLEELRRRLQELEQDERDRRARIHETMVRTIRWGAEHGVHVIKGLALRTYYEDPRLRHEGDIDFHASTWQQGRTLAAALRSQEWVWDTSELSWLKWTDGGTVFGQLSLLLPGENEADARVDLHIGPYSVGHGGLLPLVGWCERDVMGVAVQVPSPESTLALIGAHAMNDCLLSQKDINDVASILRRCPDIDWGSAEELAACSHAQGALRQIRHEVAAQHPSLSAPPGLPGGPLTASGLTGLARARRFGRLAFSDERRRSSIRQAMSTALEATRYYSAELAPKLVSGAPELLSSSARGRTQCWRLVPPSVWRSWTMPVSGAASEEASQAEVKSALIVERLSEDLDLVSREGAVVVQTMGEVFIPTVWGPVSRASADLARELSVK